MRDVESVPLFGSILATLRQLLQALRCRVTLGKQRLSRGYTSDFLLAMVMRFFLKIVASPARGENRMCSHPRTGDATDEKIAGKKSREIQ